MKKFFGIIYDWLMMAVGCAVFSVAIAVFLEPSGIAPGGASGIAIILNVMTGFPTGTAILLINIPLLILGMIGVSREFAVRSVYATVVLSLMTDFVSFLYSKIPVLTTDPFLCSVAGGVLTAVGMAFVFRHGGSTGGTDIVARLIRKKQARCPDGEDLSCGRFGDNRRVCGVLAEDRQLLLYAALLPFL